MRMASSSLVLVSRDLFMKPKVFEMSGAFQKLCSLYNAFDVCFTLSPSFVYHIISKCYGNFCNCNFIRKKLSTEYWYCLRLCVSKISVVCLKDWKSAVVFVVVVVVVVVNLSIEQLKTKWQFSWSKSKKTKTKIHHYHRRSRNHRPSWSPRPCRQPKTAFLKSFLWSHNYLHATCFVFFFNLQRLHKLTRRVWENFY